MLKETDAAIINYNEAYFFFGNSCEL